MSNVLASVETDTPESFLILVREPVHNLVDIEMVKAGFKGADIQRDPLRPGIYKGRWEKIVIDEQEHRFIVIIDDPHDIHRTKGKHEKSINADIMKGRIEIEEGANADTRSS